VADVRIPTGYWDFPALLSRTLHAKFLRAPTLGFGVCDSVRKATSRRRITKWKPGLNRKRS